MPELNEQSLEAIRLTYLEKKNEYDEKLITGLRHLVLGQIDEARSILLELAGIDESLTYIKSYLESNYKQVTSLH